MARTIGAVLTLKDKDFSSNAKKAATATEDFKRKMQHAGNGVKNFGESATSGFKRVAIGAGEMVKAIAITKVLAGAISLVKGSFESAFTRIDTMEQFERTMTTMTGSSEEVTKALDDINEYVTGTGYGLDVGASAVQNFVTRGMTIDDATDRFAIWGDAVSFYGDGSSDQLERVTGALGKMQSKGKVSMEEVNTLFDAGIDAVGMYAKATGKSTAEVQSDLSKGAISADEFLEVVDKGMREGTNGIQVVEGAAKEAGASWANAFTNMKAAVARGTISIINGIDDMLENNGLPDMRSMVAIFGKKFEGVMKSAADKIPMVAEKLGEMYQKSKPTLDWIANTGLPAVRQGIDWLTDRAKSGLGWIANTGFPAVGNKITEMHQKAQPILSWMSDTGLPAIQDGLGFVVEKATEFSNFVANNWGVVEGLANKIGDAIVYVWDSAVSMYNFISDNWALIELIVHGVAGAMGAYKLMTMASAAWTGLLAAKATILTAAQGGLAAAQGVLNAVMAANPISLVILGIGALIGIGVLLWKNWDKIKIKTQELWDKFKETKFMQKVGELMESLGNKVEKVKNFFGGVKDKFDEFKGAIGKFKLPKWVSTIGENLSSATRGAQSGAEESYAVGTNSVPRDMTANIHEGEMIIPAIQSKRLRQQGVTIDNIDKMNKTRTARVNTSGKGGNVLDELKVLINTLLANSGKSINIAKLADSIVVREEADINKFAEAFARKLSEADFNMG